MKKLLVLALVMGVASLANAGLNLVAGSTSLTPGDTTSIAITLDETTNLMGYDFVLRVDGPGTIDGANANLWVDHDWMNDPVAVTDATGFRFTAADIAMFGGSGQTGGIVANNFLFTCTGEGAALVSLYAYSSTIDGVDINAQTLATVSIDQIPEPATMALLGLGALVLRRKK